jgi:hypothetical protein
MEGGQSDAQRIVMVLQLCAAVAVCKVMSDIATRTLEGAPAVVCLHCHSLQVS